MRNWIGNSNFFLMNHASKEGGGGGGGGGGGRGEHAVNQYTEPHSARNL